MAEGRDEVVTSRPKIVGRKACLALEPTRQCASTESFSTSSNLKLPTLKTSAHPNCL